MLLIREKRETKTWRGERLGRIGLGLQPLLVVLPTNRLGSDRLFLSFIFFLPYLLVLMIQLYFKNWILFCVLYFVFGLILFLMNRTLSFLFFLFLFLFFWFHWVYEKKRNNGNRENERKKKKKKKQRREWEKKKRNPEEREIIDKISSCSNILMQEIRLLIYSSSSGH